MSTLKHEYVRHTASVCAPPVDPSSRPRLPVWALATSDPGDCGVSGADMSFHSRKPDNTQQGSQRWKSIIESLGTESFVRSLLQMLDFESLA